LCFHIDDNFTTFVLISGGDKNERDGGGLKADQKLTKKEKPQGNEKVDGKGKGA
jgi:hypothetical protein